MKKDYRALPLDAYRRIFVIAALRRASYRWYPRNDAYKVFRRERGVYECNKCHKLFGKCDVHIDHIVPIIANTGFTTYDHFVTALLCPTNELQILCKTCHKEKSKAEAKVRRDYKKGNKK